MSFIHYQRQMFFRPSTGRRSMVRFGYTLVELMAVIVIISILAAVALPSVKELLVERKTSSAAIQVKGFLEAARSRAIAEGRSVSVILERLSSRTDGNLVNPSLPLSAANPFRSITANTAPVNPEDNFDTYNSCVRMTFAASMPAVDIGVTGALVLPEDNTTVDSRAIDPDTLINEWRVLSIPISASGRLAEFLSVGEKMELIIKDRGYRFVVTKFVMGTSNWYVNFRNEGDSTHPYGLAADVNKAASSQEAVVPYVNFGTTGASASVACDRVYFLPPPRPLPVLSIDLPRGTCVDLSLSGLATDDPNVNTSTQPLHSTYRSCIREFASNWIWPRVDSTDNAPTGRAVVQTPEFFRPVYLTFSPSGALESIRCNAPDALSSRRIEPHSDVFLFIGRTDQVHQAAFSSELAAAQDASIKTNLTDPTGYWVRISPNSGAIATAPATAEHILEDIAEYRAGNPDESIVEFLNDSRSLAFTSEGTSQ